MISSEAKILNDYRNVAVVGVSPNPERPSHRVFAYLAKQGYNVIPVNPTEQEVMGKTSYPDLISVPDKVDVVDIFRRSDEIIPIVEQAIKIGAKAIWMQEGIINEKAASKARNAGLLVVMDKCMRKEHISLRRWETRHEHQQENRR